MFRTIERCKQAPGTIEASRSRECGREADRAGDGVRPHHGQAVRAGGVEIAREQSEVGAHEARACILRLGSERTVEQLPRTREFMALLRQVGCHDEEPGRWIGLVDPGRDERLGPAEIARVARAAREFRVLFGLPGSRIRIAGLERVRGPRHQCRWQDEQGFRTVRRPVARAFGGEGIGGEKDGDGRGNVPRPSHVGESWRCRA